MNPCPISRVLPPGKGCFAAPGRRRCATTPTSCPHLPSGKAPRPEDPFETLLRKVRFEQHFATFDWEAYRRGNEQEPQADRKPMAPAVNLPAMHRGPGPAVPLAEGPGGSEIPGDSGPLVSSSISQQDRLEVFPVSVRVKRPGRGNKDQAPPDRSGSWIGSFSDGSRRRLRFRAVNASPSLVSQFGLTYHDSWPTDGRESKAHLNAWLTALRRLLPGVGYLWLMEFQKRNAPHYHVFLTVPPDEETRLKLAEAWCRITAPGDAAALRFHQDQRNWISWDMGSGSYLCKYLDKEAQKAVPEGYHSFGRFWGNSRGLEAEPEVVPLDQIDQEAQVDQQTGEFYGGSSTVIRWLGRLAEKQTRGYSRFRTRAANGSYTMLQGAKAFRQIKRYFNNLSPPEVQHE